MHKSLVYLVKYDKFLPNISKILLLFILYCVIINLEIINKSKGGIILKKSIILFLSSALLLSQFTVYSQSNVNVSVNGEHLQENAYIIDNKTYIPLRAVSEYMGAQVGWDPASRTASVSYSEDTLVSSIIEEASESVVAIVGNYTPDYLSGQTAFTENYAHGTGVIIKSNGTILTNYHVVENISNLTVIFRNGESYSGYVQYHDKTADLAVVKINKLGLKPIKFASSEDIVAGKTVIAIGTPISLSLRNSASKGIISGKNVNIGEYYYYTQSDVSINGGNSGGPLLNLEGELIGINTIKLTGNGIEGMSFSIPVDTINYVLNQFETNGKVLRPVINATFTEPWEAKIGLPTKNGITVETSNEPMLQKGDVVTAVNSKEIHSIVDYHEALKTVNAGVPAVFTILRNSLELTVELYPSFN